MSDDLSPDEWLTPIQLSRRVPLTVDTLRRMRKAGTGPEFVKLGRRAFYRAAAVDAWLADATVPPAA